MSRASLKPAKQNGTSPAQTIRASGPRPHQQAEHKTASDPIANISRPLAMREPSTQDIHVGHVIRRDEIADLALVQVQDAPSDVPIVAIGKTDSVEIGDDVHAIGHPTGEDWTYTKGIVSQIRRDYKWTGDEDHLTHEATVIQTQTPINPGNSGGPLIDNDLQIVGINSFKSEGEGLNFAVSADDINSFLSRNQDRTVAVAAPTTPQTCSWTILSQKASSDPPGTIQVLDARCSGFSNLAKFIPSDPTAPIYYLTSSHN